MAKKIINFGFVAIASINYSFAGLTHIVECGHNHVIEILFQKLNSTQNILVLFQELTPDRGYLCDDFSFIVDVEHLLEFKLFLKENFELLFNNLALGDTCSHIKQLIVNPLHLLVDV